MSWNLSCLIATWILWYWLYCAWPQVCCSVRPASEDVALRTNLWALHDVWSPGTQLAFNGKKSENGEIGDFISECWIELTTSQVSFFTHKLPLTGLSLSWANKPEWAIPILDLCHGVFTSWFILRYIVELSLRWRPRPVYERIRSIRYQEGKQTFIKRLKYYFWVSGVRWQVCSKN